MHFELSLSHVKQPAGLEPDDKYLRYSQTKQTAAFFTCLIHNWIYHMLHAEDVLQTELGC